MGVADPIRYPLDANVFIQAKRSYYAFDLCPGYRKALLAHHGSGRLRSIDRVRDELLSGADELTDWVKSSVPDGFFVSSAEPAVAAWFGKMMGWVQSQAQFLPAAKTEFAGKEWLPFPFMEQLHLLYEDFVSHKKESQLSHWISSIDLILSNLMKK